MKTDLAFDPKDLPDTTFLQFMQAVWALFTELAPDELKMSPTFRLFATHLLQLEKTIVSDPLSTSSTPCDSDETQQQREEARRQIHHTYQKLAEELSNPLITKAALYQPLLDGLQRAQTDSPVGYSFYQPNTDF